MVTEQPEISWPGNRVRWWFGNDVFVGETVAVADRRQQLVELLGAEAGQPEVVAGAVQLVKLGGEQFLVPAGVERQLVVGDAVGAHLLRRQVRQADHRHRVEPEPARRQDAAVPGDHLELVVDQDRHGPAELDQRRRQLGDLVVRVRARIARVRTQLVDPQLLDAAGLEAQVGHLDSCAGERAYEDARLAGVFGSGHWLWPARKPETASQTSQLTI